MSRTAPKQRRNRKGHRRRRRPSRRQLLGEWTLGFGQQYRFAPLRDIPETYLRWVIEKADSVPEADRLVIEEFLEILQRDDTRKVTR